MEKKKAYVKPSMESEMFVPNTYVAACESGTTYWFKCDAGPSNDYSEVWEETNGIPGLQQDSSGSWWWGDYTPADRHRTSYYHACNTVHEVRGNENFLNGYVVVDHFLGDDEVIPVLIWTDHDTNTHCTTQLNPEDWEIAKS